MRFFCFVIFFLLSVQPTFAAIGQAPDPNAESFRRKGVFSVYTRTSPQVKVREYSYHGVVFAASWHGSRMPNLKRLFGSRYQDYETVHQKKAFRNERVKAGDMIIRTGGHMRDLFGLVFIPSLAPPGFTIKDVR